MNKKSYIKKFALQCLFTTFIFLMPLFSFAAQPGLHVIDWNTYIWTGDSASPFSSINHDVDVVDYDGIANDGSSHSVIVTYPDSTQQTLWFNYKIDDYTAVYSLYDNSIPQPINVVTYSGNYVYQVTDLSTGQWSEMTDYVLVDTILPPNETSFSPTLDPPQSIVAYFDDVMVNGALYDNFASGFDPLKWQYQPPLVTYIGGEARFEQINSLGRGPIRLTFLDPEEINTIKTTVRVASADSIFQARPAGFFCHNSQGEIWADVRIQGGQARYFVGAFRWEGDHFIKNTLAFTDLGPVTLGNNYELTLDWDEPSKTFTFTVIGLNDGVNYEDKYTVAGILTPPNESLKGIEVVAWNHLDTTTPTFNWDTIPGTNHYRVRIYGRYDDKLYTGYTKSPPFTLPPGILKPQGFYKYRIYAQKENQWFEADNVSASDRNMTMFWAGPDEAQDPYVDLNSIGVETWTSYLPVGTFTDFYIKVHDAQGVPGNIESVKVLLPDNVTEVNLYLDYNDSFTCGIYRGNYFGTIQAGNYTFTAIDKDENSHSQTETLTLNSIDPPVSLLPANNTVVGDTGVSFDWNDVSGAAFYQLRLYDKDLNYLFQIYTTESHYTLPPGLLEENSQYRYRVYSRREFFEDNIDNGSSTPDSVWNANTFFTTETGGTAVPTLNLDSFGVAVWQGPHPETGDPIYELDFWAMVTDSDGVPENIERVEVTYPDGTTTRLLKYLDNPGWGSNYLAVENYADLATIQTGIYSFKVVDFDGNEVTLTDTLTDVADNVLPWPTNLSPADGTVISNTTPIITWDTVSGASYYKVRILRSWGGSTVHWSTELTGTSYTVPAGALEANRTYSYRVYAYRGAIGTEVDFFSGSNSWHSTNNHFSVPDTPTGTDVEVQPVDHTTGDTPVTVVFQEVTDEGTTSLTTSEGGEPPPIGFKLGIPSSYYELETTASYSGSVDVCINYSGTDYEDESELKLFHYENDQWVDITTSLDTEENIICGSSSSLSPFAILEPNGVQEVNIDIKPHRRYNRIFLWRWGLIRVAVLSSEGFDAPNDVERSTITFGKTGDEDSLVRCARRARDVNRDGLKDLICYFRTIRTGFEVGDTMGVLKCETSDGINIQGSDSVIVIGW